MSGFISASDLGFSVSRMIIDVCVDSAGNGRSPVSMLKATSASE
jgi:hypothetical protein